MAAGNVFRFDPPPQQAGPHVIQGGSSVVPIRGPMVLATMALLVGSWPQQVERLPRLTTASVAATYASQPTSAQPIPRGNHERLSLATLQATWPALWWSPQAAAPTAGWNVPPLATYVPPVALPAAVLRSWEPAWVGPPQPSKAIPLTRGSDPSPAGAFPRASYDGLVRSWPSLWWATQTAPPFVPPTAGNEPPRLKALPVPLAIPIAAWPPLWWASQGASPNAGWNVPPLAAFLPSTPYPFGIVLAWQPPWVGPPPLETLTPPTRGDEPPRTFWKTGPTLLKAWEQPWEAQRAPRIVALSLQYGQQPPRYSVTTFALVRGLWLPEQWSAQHAAPVAGWQPLVPVLALVLRVTDLSDSRIRIYDESGNRYLVYDESGHRYRVEDV